MTDNRPFFDKLVQDFIKAKHSNYPEQCIPYYIDEQAFVVEDLPHICNTWNQKLKCTLIRHRLTGKVKHNQNGYNTRCIIYLHGLGSSRLEGLSLVQSLPKNYCLCIFDMSGSGKSGGEYVTYGLKESQDIDPVIKYIHRKKYIREFVIWGRSMGAVATLLYSMKNYGVGERGSRELSMNISLKQSKISSCSSIQPIDQQNLVKAIVLDSPFHNFREIAKQISTKKLAIPNFIIDIALSYATDAFGRIISESIGSKYNPFLISFDQSIRLSIPIIFMYSEMDEIVPAAHCQRILKNINSRFQKILINDCSHNQSRPLGAVNQIFMKLEKYNKLKVHQNRRMKESIMQSVSVCSDMERKRGIFVYTPSKDMRKPSSQVNTRSILNIQDLVSLQQIKISPPKAKSNKAYLTLSRRQSLTLNNSNCGIRQSIGKQYQTLVSEKMPSNITTIDTQTNQLIHKKILGLKEGEFVGTRILRSKRLNMQKRKEIKLTHHKYLE